MFCLIDQSLSGDMPFEGMFSPSMLEAWVRHPSTAAIPGHGQPQQLMCICRWRLRNSEGTRPLRNANWRTKLR